MKAIIRGVLAVLTATLTGCGADDGHESIEDVGSVEAPFSVAHCRNATANATFTGSIPDGGHASPSTYNTCVRGYVVDVNNVSSGLAALDISWNGPALTTQAACEASWGAGVFYRRVNGAWVEEGGMLEDFGQWISGPLGSFCSHPFVRLDDPTGGQTYRMAGTMRTQFGGATLRSILFETIEPIP